MQLRITLISGSMISILGWSFISSRNSKATMTTLFRRIKPYSFPITLDLIAKFLHIPKSLLVRAECWAYVLFIYRCNKEVMQQLERF
ncbi:MAG: hypothetical protein F6K28_32075 [Microcoleus sp. SIO2G3]|nr:hypothetical protein [Microcoleus sp. SIO2G3]